MQRDLLRSLNMLQMSLNGGTCEEIGSEFGLSRSRVSSLLRWTSRIMNPDRGYPFDIRDMRKERDVWLDRIEQKRLELGKDGGQ